MEVQQDNGSGSIEPSDQELKINLELGAWSISRRIIDAKDRSRLVIQCVEDDFGGLCPRIGLETKGLVHYGGRAAVSVQTDYGVVVLPPPAAATRGQQQSTAGQQQPAARARQQGQSRTGAARQGHRGSQSSRSWADRVTGSSSGTGGTGGAAGSNSSSNNRQPITQQQGGQQRGGHNSAAAARRVADRVARTETRNTETGGNGAAAENAAGSQAVARARQQQQQQTRLLQPQAGAGEPSGETEAAAAEDAAVTKAATAAEILQLRAQVQQLSEQAHRDRVISQGLLDAQPGLAAAGDGAKTQLRSWCNQPISDVCQTSIFFLVFLSGC
jgi:hypothetical protein